MAFRDLNARRHIGLQQLSSLALAGRTLLGPMKSCKFIVDESTNQSTLICSAVRLIESLDLTSASGQLLNETIQAQNKEFKTGMSTLLFLIGAWSNAVLECLQQNVPVSAIVSVMSEGLNSCCERVQCLQISIHDVNKELCSSSVRPNAFKSKTCPMRCDSLPNPQIFLHFQKEVSAPEVIPINSCSHQEDDCNFNKDLVSPLAGFGSIASLVKPAGDKSISVISGSGVIASSCNKQKLTHSRYFSTLGKSHFSSQQGFVTLVSPEQVTVLKYFEDKPLRILLMDGDLTEQYRHVGFNRPRNVRTILEHPSLWEGRAGDLWLSSMLDILISFEVNLVLVKGNVCENLMEKCIANSILVIGSVTQDVLCAFGEVTSAQPVTYLTQLNASCVGSGAHVELWKACDGRAMDLGELVPVRIKVRGIPLLTAVLTTTVASKMQLIEDQFWTLVYRLRHALNDEKVFLGGGAVELLCLSHIQMLAKQPLQPANKNAAKEFHNPWLAASVTEHKSVVLQALASGWKQYLSVVMCNTAKAASELEACTSVDHHLKKAADCGSPSAYILKEFRRGDLLRGGSGPFTDHGEGLKVYDNVTAKTEAWRRALDLVLLVLQTDAEIITGPKRNQLLNSRVSSEFMFL
ncbi:Bardet-Biedl syndrome 12 protein isoform X2 [Gymnogyps californianus]|uniref:Bardet-Biedl syndrome 12 protein isoform X2 n=1 Tax=Gymnogyps californianus TaxID=33616 RepID=UPI0021C65737|nr:Bardet-Biedl syndrome 12 protein isoform X2 [Gymnogyps californianus]